MTQNAPLSECAYILEIDLAAQLQPLLDLNTGLKNSLPAAVGQPAQPNSSQPSSHAAKHRANQPANQPPAKDPQNKKKQKKLKKKQTSGGLG